MDEEIAGSATAANGETVLQQRQILDHLLQLQHLQNPSQSNLLLPNPVHWQRLKPEVDGTSNPADNPAQLLNKIGPIAMAALLGFQAIPIRLKILLERIFQDLPPLSVELLLAKAGWTMVDFARGYLLNAKSEASANPSTWVCASLYTELNLLHVVSMLPAYSQLAESMRQTAIHSLVYTAVLVQQQQQQQQEVQQQTLRPTNVHPTNGNGIQMDESAHSSSLGDAEVEQLDEQKYPLRLDQNLEVPLPTNSEGNVNEVETTISIVNALAGHRSAVSLHQTTSERDVGDSEADRLMTPPFVVDCLEEDAEEDNFNGTADRVAAEARKMSRKCLKNGKRRVECPVCYKTYCDKGALKIHTSAVHLKETHCCTVEGCDKIFSSRRSRNRHSGNPSMHNLPTSTSSRLSCSLLSSPASGRSSSFYATADNKSRSASSQLLNPTSPHTTAEFLTTGPADILTIFPSLPAIPVNRSKEDAGSLCSPTLLLPSRKRKKQRPSKFPHSVRKAERNCLEAQNLTDRSQISALQSLLALGQQQQPNVPSSFSTASTVSASTDSEIKTEARGEATLRDILQAVAQKQRQPLLTAS